MCLAQVVPNPGDGCSLPQAQFLFYFPLQREFCSYISPSLVIVEVGRGMEEKDLRQMSGKGTKSRGGRKKGKEAEK